MQFRASLRSSESEASLQQPFANNVDAHFANSAHKKPQHQHVVASSSPVLPGSLLSIANASNNQRKQHHNRNERKSGAAKTKKTRAPPYVDARLAPEPIDYLKLRRTEQSKQALLRNRQVVQEIISPAPVPSVPSAASHPHTLRQNELREPLPDATAQSAAVLDELTRRFRDKGQVDSAAFAVGMQQLYHEQRRVAAQTQAATNELQHLLTGIRNDISLMYKFTPLFRIYTRHKVASRWRVWRTYVAWHRIEQERLQQLAPFAVHIQRVFRRKRTKWARARERLALAWTQWQAAIALQCWARRQLRVRALERRRETLYAARLQAAWRGRTTRKRVKRALQDELRWMLASLTPTGNLHRLQEVLVHSDPGLAKQVDAMLSLVAETHVTLDGAASDKRRPKHAAIAAKHFAHPVEATRKELTHAIHELRMILRERERSIAAAKQASVDNARTKQAEREQRDGERKREELRRITERMAEDTERSAMRAAELETREYLRMLHTAEADMRLRQQLRAVRREQAENARMVVEEYSTRYVIAESRRRVIERTKRLDEVAKREQLLYARAQQQLNEQLMLEQLNERKREEAQQRLAAARAEANGYWSSLSKHEKALALQRLEQRELERAQQQRALDAVAAAQEVAKREALQEKESRRVRKQEELACELHEREAMAREERAVRRFVLDMRKQAHAEQWLAKREREKIKYAIDPLHFAKQQEQKQQEERERRERYLMAQADALSASVREKERKERYFQLCREKKRLQLAAEAREHKERTLMEHDDDLAHALRDVANKSEAFQAQLRQMQALAAREEQRKRDQLLEAKRRIEMHDEELRQLRVMQTQAFVDSVREKHERHAMAEQEAAQRQVDAAIAHVEEKRRRTKMNLRMMKEDVASMERQDYEDEGLRLEQLLWPPHDAAAFAHCVTRHSAFLRTNVEVLQELVPALRSSLPPFELDHDAVHAHLAHEQDLPLHRVPPKKRKPRRFFYHEFFEDDPILTRAAAPVAEDAQQLEAAKHRARERWRMLGRHFLSRTWSSDAARQGYLQMHNQDYGAASTSLLTAVRAYQDASQPAPAALVRQLARCYFKRWETTAQRQWLNKSLYFFQLASAHVLLLTSPAFLQEIALVLEHAGQYRHAAEVLGGIIQCFPHYAQLAQVIFRGAVVMLALEMHRQAREYLLHVLDAAPFGWDASDLLFLIARVLQFEGKRSKKLCEVAYEDAFRQSKRHGQRLQQYAAWSYWIRAPETWRRFGDVCFAKREFVLAKDAYLVMLQRQLKKPSHLMSKRQQVRESRREHQQTATSSGSAVDAIYASEHADECKDDWLRLARVSAALGDRSKTELALTRWFAMRSYRERVLEQYCAWPLVRWRLLGLEIPERVVQMREELALARAAAETQKRQALEAQRQQVLAQRSFRSRAVRMAWQDDNSGATETAATQGTAPIAAAQLDSATSLVHDATDSDSKEEVYMNERQCV